MACVLGFGEAHAKQSQGETYPEIACECIILFAGVTAAGKAMLESDTVRKIGFTGSTPVGKHLMAGAAETVKRVSLELVGSAPRWSECTVLCNTCDVSSCSISLVDLLRSMRLNTHQRFLQAKAYLFPLWSLSRLCWYVQFSSVS